jgi:hypothetical protein
VNGDEKETEEEQEYEVETIADHEIADGKLWYNVKWLNWPEDENTIEPDDHLTNAERKVTRYWEGRAGEKSDWRLQTRMAQWNRYWTRHWRYNQRGRRTYRERIIACIGAVVEKNSGLWFVMGKEDGTIEPLRLTSVKSRCPDKYAQYIDSAFPA